MDGGVHFCEERKQQQSKQLQKEEMTQLKNLLESQILLEVMYARLTRVEKMLFNDAN